MTVFRKYDRMCFGCDAEDYQVFASGLRWWRCKCNQCGWQWFTYGEEPPVPVNIACIQMPLLTNGELILVKKELKMDMKVCEQCGTTKLHRYAFCPQCGHDNYETRKREAVEEYLGELLEMIQNIREYVDIDSHYLDRDPDFEREIIEEAHGFIKHRDCDNLESVEWLQLSPEGWYMVKPTDAQCEELYEEASEWLFNAVK